MRSFISITRIATATALFFLYTVPVSAILLKTFESNNYPSSNYLNDFRDRIDRIDRSYDNSIYDIFRLQKLNELNRNMQDVKRSLDSIKLQNRLDSISDSLEARRQLKDRLRAIGLEVFNSSVKGGASTCPANARITLDDFCICNDGYRYDFINRCIAESNYESTPPSSDYFSASEKEKQKARGVLEKLKQESDFECPPYELPDEYPFLNYACNLVRVPRVEQTCPAHSQLSADGETCECDIGYEPDSTMTECVQTQKESRYDEHRGYLQRESNAERRKKMREERIRMYGGAQKSQDNKKTSLLPSDVSVNDWYTDAVLDYVKKGYLNESQLFQPEVIATRAEFIKLIVKIKGSSFETQPKKPSFDDVAITSPYFRYFEDAAGEGWVKGNGQCYGQHPCYANPYKPVNRAEAATLILKAFKLTNTTSAPVFVDVKKGTWYEDAIIRTAGHCILQGNTASAQVRPSDTMNRAEMVVMLQRVEEGRRYPHCK